MTLYYVTIHLPRSADGRRYRPGDFVEADRDEVRVLVEAGYLVPAYPDAEPPPPTPSRHRNTTKKE